MTAFAGEFMNSFDDRKTAALAEIIRLQNKEAPAKVLVVGCGAGTEAAVLAEELGAEVVGIDVLPDFDPRAAELAEFCVGNATRMGFADESFDFVYSYHALEHIPDHNAALYEIRRVLKQNGEFLIGTPNSARLIAYLGSRDATFAEKVRWNFLDWKAKFNGRFKNEYGAHAGFTLAELHSDLAGVFSVVNDITPDYYLRVYAGKRALVSWIYRMGIWRWLFPAIYFYGKR
jgi:SAM-dependent methyltransferase